MKEVYRQCASLVVFRTASVCSPDGCSDVQEILLLHKPRKKDAWQLPQGGIEKGESIEEAALRELMEEANISATILGRAKHTYQYDFPNSYRKFRPDNVKGQHIDFVLAKLNPNQTVQVDDDEIDGHAWVLPADIGKYLKRKRYLSSVYQLVKEGKKLLG